MTKLDKGEDHYVTFRCQVPRCCFVWHFDPTLASMNNARVYIVKYAASKDK